MSEPNVSGTQEGIKCENCATVNAASQRFCTSCGFPIQGTDDEKMHFRTRISYAKVLLEDANKKTRKAKIIILVLAGFSILYALIMGFGADDFGSMIVFLFLGLLYLGLAFWCDRNPFGAILTAFILYITLQVLGAFVDPASLAQGIFLKIFFIAAFVTGTRSAWEAQQYRETLKKSKALEE